MAKVYIGVGHSGVGIDPGAVANGLVESSINLVMSLALRDELVRHGVDVAISRIAEKSSTTNEKIASCNAFAPDLAVEVHNNAGGGDGFEVYRQTNSYAAESIKLAQAIEARVKELGQNSRGIKTRLNTSGTDYFGMLREVKCPSVLLEGAFLDNKTDMQIIDTIEEQEAFGVAYAKGILDYLGIAWWAVTTDSTGGQESEAAFEVAELRAEIKRLSDELTDMRAEAAGFRAKLLEAAQVLARGA